METPHLAQRAHIDTAQSHADLIKLLSIDKKHLTQEKSLLDGTFLSILIKTCFKEKLFTYLKYLREPSEEKGASDKRMQTGVTNWEEVENEIINLNSLKNLSLSQYFQTLLESGFISINELFDLIVIHEQNIFFDLSLKNSNIDLILLITNLKDTENKNLNEYISSIKERNIKDKFTKLAIFGATYAVQKGRLTNGLDFIGSYSSEATTAENIYLLTGYRKVFLSELIQLGIIENADKVDKITNLIQSYNKKTESKLPNILTSLYEILNKEEYKEQINQLNIDFDKLREILKKIQIAQSLYKNRIISNKNPNEILLDSKNNTEIEEMINLNILKYFANCGEVDLFILIALEKKLDPEKVQIIYSEELSSSSTSIIRSNTQDTVRALYETDSDFANILFVSNNIYINAQKAVILDILTEKEGITDTEINIYGETASVGELGNIAGTHYTMEKVISRVFNPSLTPNDIKKRNEHLSRNSVKKITVSVSQDTIAQTGSAIGSMTR